jgi:hypothetical protein
LYKFEKFEKSRHIQYNYTPVPARSEADYIQNICENQISVWLLKNRLLPFSAGLKIDVIWLDFFVVYKMHWPMGSWICDFKHYRQQSMGKLYFVGFLFSWTMKSVKIRTPWDQISIRLFSHQSLCKGLRVSFVLHYHICNTIGWRYERYMYLSYRISHTFILWNYYYHGVLIFTDFMVHENKNPTKYNFPIDCCL